MGEVEQVDVKVQKMNVGMSPTLAVQLMLCWRRGGRMLMSRAAHRFESISGRTSSGTNTPGGPNTHLTQDQARMTMIINNYLHSIATSRISFTSLTLCCHCDDHPIIPLSVFSEAKLPSVSTTLTFVKGRHHRVCSIFAIIFVPFLRPPSTAFFLQTVTESAQSREWAPNHKRCSCSSTESTVTNCPPAFSAPSI